MHNYTIMCSEMENKQMGVAIAMRHDVMKNHKVGVRKMTKQYVEIALAKAGGEIRIASVYSPPETSRHYNDGILDILLFGRRSWTS